MTELQDTINWGIGTGITIGVAGMAMQGMRRLSNPTRRYRRSRRKKL